MRTKTRRFLVILTILLMVDIANGKTSPIKKYYVSPKGNDGGSGTIELPFSTIQRAQSVCVPGDTVYIRGGSYIIQNTQIAKTDSHNFRNIE